MSLHQNVRKFLGGEWADVNLASEPGRFSLFHSRDGVWVVARDCDDLDEIPDDHAGERPPFGWAASVIAKEGRRVTGWAKDDGEWWTAELDEGSAS
jgi:hypothetical protein